MRAEISPVYSPEGAQWRFWAPSQMFAACATPAVDANDVKGGMHEELHVASGDGRETRNELGGFAGRLVHLEVCPEVARARVSAHHSAKSAPAERRSVPRQAMTVQIRAEFPAFFARFCFILHEF